MERLQLRLDEAVMNKQANERMEESDKAPWRTRTRLRIMDSVASSAASGISSRSQSSSNVSPRTQQSHRTRATALNAQRTTEASPGRSSLVKQESANSNQSAAHRVTMAGSEQDQGEYYIRRYRRESRTATGGFQVIQVKDYRYWPPEGR